MLNRIGIAATISIALAAALMGAVPNPIVTGPIPALVPPGDPSHDYTFFSTTVDLASYGYVEEEFLLRRHRKSLRVPKSSTAVRHRPFPLAVTIKHAWSSADRHPPASSTGLS